MSNCEASQTDWYPQHVIHADASFALLILNQPLNDDLKHFVLKNWNTAAYRVAVDGGALRLKEISDQFKDQQLLPDLICGDFDSVTPDVLDFYRSQGVSIVPTPDQDETDFTKALRLTVKHLDTQKLNVSTVLVVSRNGDRLDHIFGNLNTLYLASELTSSQVIIMGNNSLTWLLHKGFHRIHVSKEMMNSHVGLIPLGEECTDVTSTGLKWNLFKDKMKFGGLISTCNLFDGSDIVTVSTNSPLVWTMEITCKT